MDKRSTEDVIAEFSGIIIARFFIALVFQLLWNALLPPLASAPAISYWQSLGLLYLLFVVGNLFNNK